MLRSSALCALCLAVAGVITAMFAQRTNIIVILTDDQGYAARGEIANALLQATGPGWRAAGLEAESQ